MNWLAIDIGGANLKAANGLGYATCRPFALWQDPSALAIQLRTLIAESPGCERLAVTMTAELADCFASKSVGVLAVLDAVEAAAGGRHVRVYRDDGRLVAPAAIRRTPLRAAACNWHAWGSYVALRSPTGATIALDIGSTTIDIVPIRDGRIATDSVGDLQRLLSRELLYQGIERTPLASIVSALPYRGQMCPVARERFATTLDVYILLGWQAESLHRESTADGQPATKRASRMRMGRMVCAADEEFNHRDAARMAEYVMETQATEIVESMVRVADRKLDGRTDRIVVGGHGDGLARRVLEQLVFTGRVISMSHEMGAQVSRCATAHALAHLARQAES